MFFFLLHLFCFLFQLGYFLTSRPDVCAQLLDLVVKHKLELLQFLGFLLQVVDPLIFVSNSMLAFRQFKLLRLDRRLQLVEQSD